VEVTGNMRHMVGGDRVRYEGEMMIGREDDEWRTGVREQKVEGEREM
jgi:hypothetical protein